MTLLALLLLFATSAFADPLTSDFFTPGTCQQHRCVRDEGARPCNAIDYVCGSYADGTACEMLFCDVWNDGETTAHVYLGVMDEAGSLDQVRMLTIMAPGGTTGVGFYVPSRSQCYAEALESTAQIHLNAWPLEVMP